MKISKDILQPDSSLVPIILSGGKGTRLWPLSRECFPKQYLNLDENSDFSLLQNTYLRLRGLNDLSLPIIICNEEQRFIVAEQMRNIEVQPKSIILEPFGRNTAPAIAVAALHATKEKKDPYLLILSADHKIENNIDFKKSINHSLKYADNGSIVTFGVIPDKPETGFGYIESFDELTKNLGASRIKRFVEKPTKAVAKEFIRNKHFTWNSGIFLFKASTILEELLKYGPEIIEYCNRSLENSTNDLDFLRLEEENFSKCPNLAIDVAVMEKTKRGVVVPLTAGWSDIGSWEALSEKSRKDNEGNTLKGKTIIKNSNNCYVRSEERLIVGIGLTNLVVIETNDAILISDKNVTQKVKDVVIDLEKLNLKEGKFNKQIYRPWGNYTSISIGSTWQVKKLEIKPGASLSLQMHNSRSEHWVVVSGEAKVEINTKISILKKNESIYIPAKAKHRLSNESSNPLVLIEVQSGSYLGEDDIIRFDDIYGRGNNEI